MNKENVLGLDLGISSIGWALLNKNNIKDAGVIKFDSPIDLVSGTSPGQERNLFKMARKQLFRKKLRKSYLKNFFIKNGLISKDFDFEEFVSLNPYELRHRAVHGTITDYEFARICYQLIQRRGYKTENNFSEPNESSNKIETGYGDLIGMETTNEAFVQSGCLTIGEYFYTLYPNDNEQASKIRGRFVPRKLYIDELNFIIQKQKNNIPILNDEKFINDLLNPKTGILFFQRPLKSQKHKVGKCSFEKKKTRIKKSHPSFEVFRVLQLINNISWLDSDDNVCKSSKEQTRNILNLFKTKSIIKPDEILNLLGLTKKECKSISFEGLDLKGSYPGCRTHILMNNIFGADRWEGFSDKEKIEIWNLFNFFEKDEVKKCLYTKYNLDDTHLSYIDTAVLSDDYGSVSKKFIDAVMPFLENGYNHFTSTTFAGVIKAFGKRWSTFSKEQQDDILREIYNLSSVTGDDSTYMDRVSGLLFEVHNLKDEDLNKLYNHSTILQPRIKPIQPGEKINLPKTVNNPAVNKVLFLIRKLISEIIEKYGSIEQINIEMARDFGLNKTAIDAINKKQKENAKTNQFLTKELPLGVKDTTLNLKKMRLYKECGGLCVYTGDGFTKEQIFNGEINLEHIVPYSIIPNNSIKNLALCYVDENLKKGNKTPFEFYSSNISKWKEVKARAKQVFNSDKYLHFISESKPDFQDFANRQLNDTRHIMTEVKDYLFENICSNIMVTTGEVTSKIRTSWGLNEILGTTDSKNTLDNRNHAVDAIVIAYTSLSIQRKILDLKRDKISIFDNIPTPYDLKQLQRDVTNIICNIITKHQEKKRFKSSGTIRRNLHDSNPFGKLSNGSFVKRKAISSFDTHGSIKKIVDLQVRKSIETHLLTYANEILANDNKIKDNPYINLDDLYQLNKTDFKFLCKKALSDKNRPVYLLNKNNVRGEIIKKARFSENSKLMSIGSGKTVKYVSPNNNELWIAEWIPEKDKYITKTISCLELSKNYRKSFNNNKNIILRINDMVLASQDINTNIPLENINKETLSKNIYRVQKTTEGILYLISHKEASVPNPKLENKDNIQTIKIGTGKDIIKYNLRKLQINNIGHIKTSGI